MDLYLYTAPLLSPYVPRYSLPFLILAPVSQALGRGRSWSSPYGLFLGDHSEYSYLTGHACATVGSGFTLLGWRIRVQKVRFKHTSASEELLTMVALVAHLRAILVDLASCNQVACCQNRAYLAWAISNLRAEFMTQDLPLASWE